MINVNLLPKNLQRRREPGYWRLIAVVFPVIVLAVIGMLQFSVLQTEKKLAETKSEREVRLELLRPFVEEQNELQARQRELDELIAVRNAVQEGRIIWSEQIFAMLETLPAQGAGLDSRIAFGQLDMRALEPGARDRLAEDNTYEGVDVVAEMEIQGTAGSTEILADYIRQLQTSERFGVSFRDASRESDSDLYTFSLTVGAAGLDLDSDAGLDSGLDAANAEVTQ